MWQTIDLAQQPPTNWGCNIRRCLKLLPSEIFQWLLHIFTFPFIHYSLTSQYPHQISFEKTFSITLISSFTLNNLSSIFSKIYTLSVKTKKNVAIQYNCFLLYSAEAGDLLCEIHVNEHRVNLFSQIKFPTSGSAILCLFSTKGVDIFGDLDNVCWKEWATLEGRIQESE